MPGSPGVLWCVGPGFATVVPAPGPRFGGETGSSAGDGRRGGG